MSKVNYENKSAGFYDDLFVSPNPVQAWFHYSRNTITNKYVLSFYREGMKIADLGCGNVSWNTKKLPVIGVDINENFLSHNLDQKKISQAIISPLIDIPLPNESIDIIVITEVLEHLADPHKHIEEFARILKPGGIIICSVPYDVMLSLWRPLFFLQCFVNGYIKKDMYYKQKCGHINRFSRKKLRKLFLCFNFAIIEQHNFNYLTLFTIARKTYV